MYRHKTHNFTNKANVEVWVKTSSPLTDFVYVFFFLERVFSCSRLPLHAPSPPPSIPSLISLMQRLELTRARISKEKLDRTQKRKNELLSQERRETGLVRERTETLKTRTAALSRSLFEARRETFILKQKTETLSRSFVLLSRLCYLLFVCLAFVLVFHLVDLCDKRWQQGSQVDIKGRQWSEI